MVGDFRSIATAVAENQKATLGVHQDFLQHRQGQAEHLKTQQAMFQNMQQQIDELKKTLAGTQAPPYPSSEAPQQTPAPVTPDQPVTRSQASSPSVDSPNLDLLKQWVGKNIPLAMMPNNVDKVAEELPDVEMGSGKASKKRERER
eukprot:7026833-Alexandrium_andersonii.AAC.1